MTGWQSPDWDASGFYIPRDFFVVQVVQRQLGVSASEDASLKLTAAQEFADAHGRHALLEALRVAAAQPEGLPPVLAHLLTRMQASAA